MPHYPHLIDGHTLSSVPDIVVFDCRFNLADPGWGERAYREGHLPGARFADLDRDLSSPVGPTSGRLQGNLSADGRFLSPGQLRARFLAALGERPPHAVVHACGSGVNACHNVLAMEVAGLTGSKLYAGSWSEWIRDPKRPVASGE